MEPFIYNGTTFLPVRAISEALGKEVEWDGPTSSVYIGEYTGKPPENTGFEEITVGTAEEFIAAIGSNRRILLKEGYYNLSDVSYINDPSVYFRDCFDGYELVLDGIRNLSIESEGDGWCELIAEPRYAFVMNFLNCSNISLSGIKAGHTDTGYCAGGVFSFENSSGIQIDDTLMYGCGTVGLQLLRVSNMYVTNSTVYGCTYGIMYIGQSADILFRDCVFRDNTTFSMVEMRNTTGVTFDSCSFLRNTAEYYPGSVFSILHSGYLTVRNTVFSDNVAHGFFDWGDWGYIEFEDSNTFENNSFAFENNPFDY